MNAIEHCMSIARHRECEIIRKFMMIDIAGNRGMFKYGFDFRTKNESTIRMMIIHWFYADAISGHE